MSDLTKKSLRFETRVRKRERGEKAFANEVHKIVMKFFLCIVRIPDEEKISRWSFCCSGLLENINFIKIIGGAF